MNSIKQIPYGVSDFVSVRNGNLYYVDKTKYLIELENQPRFLIFIRPRRFGKSLFISMMRAYYDKAMQGKFDALFGDLWIGQHPTPLKGRYEVLYLDFSQAGGSYDKLAENFDNYCCDVLDSFIDTYAADYPARYVEEIRNAKNTTQKLNKIQIQSSKLGIPLYLIIDEYDNFTNVVLNEQGEKIYHGMTHASGFYREVFKKFKIMFERIFMTGVSPVTLDDLTSGFNIGWNVSTKWQLDKILGFSVDDVHAMFTYYKDAGLLPAACDIEAMITEMMPWYDNYCFAEECLNDGNPVFNCDMVLYYLRNYIDDGHAPKQMLDSNTKTDYDKLKKLIQLDKLDGDRKGVIRKIIEEGQIVVDLYTSFSALDMTKPTIFPSLLFYYGMLTIVGIRGPRLILGIPNNNVRKQYYSYLLEEYESKSRINIDALKNSYDDMALDGKWCNALQHIADSYTKASSVRSSIEGERSIQGYFLAYLSLNAYYITAPELEISHGYCDFFLLPDMTHYQSSHSYIIELKYLSKKDYEDKEHSKAEVQWQEAVTQINGYAVAPRVVALRQGTTLHKIIMQFAGWELKRMEEITTD